MGELLLSKLRRCTALWKVKAAWPLANISGPSIEFELCCSQGASQVKFSVLSIQLQWKKPHCELYSNCVCG